MNIRQKLCDQEKTVRRAADANKRKGHNGITQTPGGDACNMYVVDPLDGGTESNKPPEEFNLELVVGMAPSCPPPPHGYTTGSSTSANELSKHKRITLSQTRQSNTQEFQKCLNKNCLGLVLNMHTMRRRHSAIVCMHTIPEDKYQQNVIICKRK